MWVAKDGVAQAHFTVYQLSMLKPSEEATSMKRDTQQSS
jgi:hypothetical protein